MSDFRDFLQGASNAAASNVSAPVDGLAWLLRKAGVPIPANPVGGSDWMRGVGLTAEPQSRNAGLVGEAFGGVAPMLAVAKAPQIAAGLLKGAENLAAPATLNKEAGVILNLRPGASGFDPRFDTRVKEADRLKNLRTTVDARDEALQSVPAVSLTDYAGHPFITSMADRVAAGGRLIGVNDTKLPYAVDLRGGQDFMFENPGMAWASGAQPTRQIFELAQQAKQLTGKDPLYIPWRMAPSGGDFGAMGGETMLSYASANLGKADRAVLDKQIGGLIPGWKGVDSPESLAQFQGAKDKVRKTIQKQILDKNFRERGGLGLGEARLAVTDPKQLSAPDGGLMNVGLIHADRQIIQNSGHPYYPRGVPGEGLGRLTGDHNVFELLPHAAKVRGIPNPKSPRQEDLRALQMKPYMGVLDDQTLKLLGY